MFAMAVKLLSMCCKAVDPSAAVNEGRPHGKQDGKQT